VTKSINTLVLVIGLALTSAACAGGQVRQGRSPMILVIDSLTATAGGSGTAGSTLQSDVFTAGGVISDSGSVTFRLVPKDPIGAAPSEVNAVVIDRYRVEFRRSDGRRTPGEDVPFPFDSALTVRVPPLGPVSAGFEFVRHNAKREAPLAALRTSLVKISTIADITFFGKDLAGNDVSATGSIGVTFGDFADP
jgi:hypothetical protein